MLFKNLVRRFLRIHSSIYGQVIYVITFLSLFLLLAYSFIFCEVSRKHLESVIHESGNNVGVLVQGALYYSMLQNDKMALQNTLDVLPGLSGVNQVNMYDKNDSLVYTSYSPDMNAQGNPDCKSCHEQFATMFPKNEKAFVILDKKSDCVMNQVDEGHRQLLIKAPILNDKSCYQSACHYHRSDDDVLGSLIIKMPLERIDAALVNSSNDFILLATFTTLLLVLIVVFITKKKIKDPLHAIITASESVARGDKGTRLALNPKQLYDIRMVSVAFNHMLDNIMSVTRELENWSQQLEYKIQKKTEELGEVQNEMIHIERIASLGKLSLSVAHEINNPLSGILIYTKLIQKQLNNPDLDNSKKESVLKNLSLIESETKRCGDIVKSLLDFSRKDQENFEPVHLQNILRETCELMQHPMKIANISFINAFNATSDLVYCSPNQIKQAYVAMLVNASEAVSENGEISLKAFNPDADTLIVEVTDNGVGIAEEDLPHIFEPFFSTKQKISGTGLGLAIVHGIVQSHHGKIEVHSKPGKGTRLSVQFPLIKS